MVSERPHSTLSLQTLPALQNFPFFSLFLSKLETILKMHCFSNQWFSEPLQRRWSPSCWGKWQSHLDLVLSWHMLLSEGVMSSWKSSWAPLGQVSVPVALLEHSKPQTLVPLTHISNLEDCSTDTRKTAPNNAGTSLQSCSEVSLSKDLFRGV